MDQGTESMRSSDTQSTLCVPDLAVNHNCCFEDNQELLLKSEPLASLGGSSRGANAPGHQGALLKSTSPLPFSPLYSEQKKQVPLLSSVNLKDSNKGGVLSELLLLGEKI